MTNELFKTILNKHKRIAIIGGPRVGKTTLARQVTDRPVHHNDDGKHLGWDVQPHFWMNRVKGQDSFIIEGVQAARCLRKGMQVDAIIHLEKPHVPLSKGQQAMHKGQSKIIREALALNPAIPVYK